MNFCEKEIARSRIRRLSGPKESLEDASGFSGSAIWKIWGCKSVESRHLWRSGRIIPLQTSSGYRMTSTAVTRAAPLQFSDAQPRGDAINARPRATVPSAHTARGPRRNMRAGGLVLR